LQLAGTCVFLMQQLQDSKVELQLATLDTQLEALASREGLHDIQPAAAGAVVPAAVAAQLKKDLEKVRSDLGEEVASVLRHLQETLDQVGQQYSSSTWAQAVRQQLEEALSARYEVNGVTGKIPVAAAIAEDQPELHRPLDSGDNHNISNSADDHGTGNCVPGGVNLPQELQQLLQLMLCCMGPGGSNSKESNSWGSAAGQNSCSGVDKADESFITANGGPATLLGAARPWITTPSGTVTPMYSRRGTEVSIMGGRKHQSARSSLANGLFASRAGSQAGAYGSCGGSKSISRKDNSGSGLTKTSSTAGGGARGSSMLGLGNGRSGPGCSSSAGTSRLAEMRHRSHEAEQQDSGAAGTEWEQEEQHRLQQEVYFQHRQHLHEQEQQQLYMQQQPWGAPEGEGVADGQTSVSIYDHQQHHGQHGCMDAAAVGLLEDMYLAAHDQLQALEAAACSNISDSSIACASESDASPGPSQAAAQGHMEAAHKLMQAAQEHLKAATTAAAGVGPNSNAPGTSSNTSKATLVDYIASEASSGSVVARNRQMWMDLLSSARSLATPTAPCHSHNRGQHSPSAPSYLGLLYQPYTRVHRMCKITAPAANMHSAVASSSPLVGPPEGDHVSSPQHHSSQPNHQQRLLV
jgi:hypothetical protein